MKNIFRICLLAFSVLTSAHAGSLVTATVTITGPTTNGMTAVVNGSTRTWTNVVATPTTQIQTNSTIGGTLTNLFLHFAANGISGIVLSANGTNSMKFIGDAVTISFTGGYATVSYATNTTGQGQMVRVPFDVLVATNRTNNASWIVAGLDSYSTNAFSNDATALTNHVNRGSAQSISGAKTFTGANVHSNSAQIFSFGTVSNVTVYVTNGTIANVTISGGTNNGAIITNAVSIDGAVGTLSGGLFIAPTLTNAVNRGNAFSSPGTGLSSEQFGSGAQATGIASLAFGVTAWALTDGAMAIGNLSYATGTNAMAIGQEAQATAENATALGQASIASHVNSTAIGFGATTTRSNQTVIGSGTVDVTIGGKLETSSITNSTFTGTNNWNGDISFQARANSSQANGVNGNVVLGTNVLINLSGATTIATNCGFVGERDGSFHILFFDGATNNVILNESGLNTPANRIVTGTSGSLTLTNQPAWIEVIYRSSRWHVLGHSN